MKRTYLVLIITMLVIGFAAVATNLAINGTINFGFNNDDFNSNVVFTYANAYNGTAEIDKGTEKTISFTSGKLENVNQKAILRYDIANKSNQYDAEVTIDCGFGDGSSTFDEWLDIENDLDSSFKLQAGETKEGNLTVILTKAYDDSLTEDVNIKCTIDASPAGREEKQEYVPVEHNYEEVLLQGTDPVLEAVPVEGISLAAETSEKKLIPVTISDEGEVKKADITQKWYDYEHQEWANAVILVDGATEPEAGEVIEENSIESYFVWIPKFKYKLWNADTDHLNNIGPFPIEVEFGTEDTTDEQGVSCIVPLNTQKTQAVSGDTGNCNNGEWMTHPAFITMGVNGFWVGKFEVGYKDAKSKKEAQVNSDSSSNIVVKPDVYSWRGMTNKNIFNALKNYATNLDSHMIKNTEWGAVAILSHTVYGINTEVAQNKTLEYRTGYGISTDGVLSPYPDQSVFKSSTTGNITGIYDMSGGAWERTAAYRNVENNDDTVGISGFTKSEILEIGEKYFDVYDIEITRISYEKRILGDATGEMGPFNNYVSNWYQDYANFIASDSPWIERGGMYSDTITAGIFHFGRGDGGTNTDGGSRLVLSPQ